MKQIIKSRFLHFLLIVTVLLSPVSLTSCSSGSGYFDFFLDDEYMIVGTWILKEVNGTVLNDNRHYIVIEANHTYRAYPSGNPFGLTDSGTWEIDGKILTFNKSESSVWHITSMTGSEMVVSGPGWTVKLYNENPNTPTTINVKGVSTTVQKLTGKWRLTKYRMYNEEVQKNGEMVLNDDMTYKISPRNLFEDEKTSGKWSLTNNNSVLKFGNSDGAMYVILKNTNKHLELGWLEYGDVIEWTTFERVE